MDNKYQLAQQQIGEGLGAIAEIDAKKKAVALAAAKEHYSKLKDDSDFNLKIASDKSFSSDARKNAWNIVQANRKAMDKSYSPMFIDKWDPTTETALNDIGVMQQKMTKGEIDQNMFNKFQVDRIKQVMMDPAASQSEKESAMAVMKAIQDTNAVTPRTITQGGRVVEGNQDRTGNFTPLQMGGQVAETPNTSLMGAELNQRQFEEQTDPKKLSIPGFINTGAVKIAPEEAQKLREGKAAFDSFTSTLKSYKDLINKYGPSEMTDRKIQAQFDSKSKALQLDIKKIAQLGVLSAGDLPYMLEQVPNSKVFATKKGMLGALEATNGTMKTKFLSEMEARGYKAANESQDKKVLKWNPKTRKVE